MMLLEHRLFLICKTFLQYYRSSVSRSRETIGKENFKEEVGHGEKGRGCENVTEARHEHGKDKSIKEESAAG